MTRLTRSIGVLAATSLALTGCSTISARPEQVLNDTSMTTEIKTRLATEARLSTLTDDRRPHHGRLVRLTGTVADEDGAPAVGEHRPATSPATTGRDASSGGRRPRPRRRAQKQ